MQLSGEHMLLKLLHATVGTKYLASDVKGQFSHIGAGEGERKVSLWIINSKSSKQLFFYSFFALFRIYVLELILCLRHLNNQLQVIG